MDEINDIKAKYIESATINKKAASEGDYKTANKQAKIHLKILKGLENNSLEKGFLIELLNHEYIGVSCLASIDLLRLRYETQKAEKNLERIASMDETNMTVDEKLTVMAAQIQLESWREKGFVT